jgi:cell division protein ZapA (FtsZ GTPase activity inhibitor)
VDEGVLQVVGRQGPVGRPADEEDHLLATVKVVDDSSSGGAGELT